MHTSNGGSSAQQNEHFLSSLDVALFEFLHSLGLHSRIVSSADRFRFAFSFNFLLGSPSLFTSLDCSFSVGDARTRVSVEPTPSHASLCPTLFDSPLCRLEPLPSLLVWSPSLRLSPSPFFSLLRCLDFPPSPSLSYHSTSDFTSCIMHSISTVCTSRPCIQRRRRHSL